MSRRGRHGRHPHTGSGARPRPVAQAPERPAPPVEARMPARTDAVVASVASPEVASTQDGWAIGVAAAAPELPTDVAAVVREPAPVQVRAPAPVRAREPEPAPPRPPEPARPPDPAPAAAPLGRPDGSGEDLRPTCTVPQLRRFIKSRPWIPMHELRRRFGIYGGDDDVSPIRVGEHTLFIGLPPVESRLMAELLCGGDVGYELSLDPVTPIVVGVYPMRPVPRG
jgi:hypothetical protein